MLLHIYVQQILYSWNIEDLAVLGYTDKHRFVDQCNVLSSVSIFQIVRNQANKRRQTLKLHWASGINLIGNSCFIVIHLNINVQTMYHTKIETLYKTPSICFTTNNICISRYSTLLVFCAVVKSDIHCYSLSWLLRTTAARITGFVIPWRSLVIAFIIYNYKLEQAVRHNINIHDQCILQLNITKICSWNEDIL